MLDIETIRQVNKTPKAAREYRKRLYKQEPPLPAKRTRKPG